MGRGNSYLSLSCWCYTATTGESESKAFHPWRHSTWTRAKQLLSMVVKPILLMTNVIHQLQHSAHFSPVFCFFPALFLSAPGNKSENIRVVWLGLPPFLAPASRRSWGQTSTNSICWPLELSFCGWKGKSSRATPSPVHSWATSRTHSTKTVLHSLFLATEFYNKPELSEQNNFSFPSLLNKQSHLKGNSIMDSQ